MSVVSVRPRFGCVPNGEIEFRPVTVGQIGDVRSSDIGVGVRADDLFIGVLVGPQQVETVGNVDPLYVGRSDPLVRVVFVEILRYQYMKLVELLSVDVLLIESDQKIRLSDTAVGIVVVVT